MAHSGICVFHMLFRNQFLPSNRRVCPVPRPEVKASRSVGKMTIHGAAHRENGNIDVESATGKETVGRWGMAWRFFGWHQKEMALFLGERFLEGVAGYIDFYQSV